MPPSSSGECSSVEDGKLQNIGITGCLLHLLPPHQLSILIAFTCPAPPLPAAGSSATAGGWASTGAGAGDGGACCTPLTTTTPGSMQYAWCQVAASPRGAVRAQSTSGEAGGAALAGWPAGVPAGMPAARPPMPASAASCLQPVATYSGAASGRVLHCAVSAATPAECAGR
jgi:hypothetical protein